jgi:hypothetical protein
MQNSHVFLTQRKVDEISFGYLVTRTNISFLAEKAS